MSDDSGDEREGGRGGYSVSQLEVVVGVVGAGLYFSLLCSLENRPEVRMVPSIWSRAMLTLRPHTYTMATSLE